MKTCWWRTSHFRELESLARAWHPRSRPCPFERRISPQPAGHPYKIAALEVTRPYFAVVAGGQPAGTVAYSSLLVQSPTD